jgi:hypothetical protein
MRQSGAGQSEAVARHTVGDALIGAVDKEWSRPIPDRGDVHRILGDQEAFTDPLPLIVNRGDVRVGRRRVGM